MLEVFEGVAATSLLVNESRARQPELSGDRFAERWIPDEHREAVRHLWAGFAEAVYRDDDIVVSVRGRAVLQALTGALASAPDLTLLCLAAGFTSYPWLLPIRRSIEVDLPSVADAKSARAAQLAREGVLPERDVVHVAVDLAAPGALDQVRAVVDDVAPPGGPVAIVSEGFLYYLPRPVGEDVLGLAGRLDRPVAAAVTSFWPVGPDEHPVLARQAAWFEGIGVSGSTTALASDEVVALLGDGAASSGPEALQRAFGVDPVRAELDLVPEHVATWFPS